MTKPIKVGKRTRRYVDEAFRLLQYQPDVKEVIILNQSANPIRTTMEHTRAVEYCGYYEMLYQKMRYILQQIDPEDELMGLRVRTRWDETLVLEDGKITVMVVQNPKDMIQQNQKKLET